MKKFIIFAILFVLLVTLVVVCSSLQKIFNFTTKENTQKNNLEETLDTEKAIIIFNDNRVIEKILEKDFQAIDTNILIEPYSKSKRKDKSSLLELNDNGLSIKISDAVTIDTNIKKSKVKKKALEGTANLNIEF